MTENNNKNNIDKNGGKPFKKRKHYFDRKAAQNNRSQVVANEPIKEVASVKPTQLATKEDLLKLKDFFDKKYNKV